jgi:anti-anti-sigma regulatory factor
MKKFKDKIGDTRKKGSMTIIVNMEKVASMQVAHLQQLVPPIRALTAIGGKVAFCNMNKGLSRAIQTAMFYPLVKVFVSEDEAVTELMS